MTETYVVVPRKWRRRLSEGNETCPYKGVVWIHTTPVKVRRGQNRAWRGVTTWATVYEGDVIATFEALWHARHFADAIICYEPRGTTDRTKERESPWNSRCTVVDPDDADMPTFSLHPFTDNAGNRLVWAITKSAVIDVEVDDATATETRCQVALSMQLRAAPGLSAAEWQDSTLAVWRQEEEHRTVCRMWPPAVHWMDGYGEMYRSSRLLIGVPIDGERRVVLPKGETQGDYVRINKLQSHNKGDFGYVNWSSFSWLVPGGGDNLHAVAVGSFVVDDIVPGRRHGYEEEQRMLLRGLESLREIRATAAQRIQNAWRAYRSRVITELTNLPRDVADLIARLM
jgi:hypothetical protein